jgi:hypothetical protein
MPCPPLADYSVKENERLVSELRMLQCSVKGLHPLSCPTVIDKPVATVVEKALADYLTVRRQCTPPAPVKGLWLSAPDPGR